jgi:hypothetical protein
MKEEAMTVPRLQPCTTSRLAAGVVIAFLVAAGCAAHRKAAAPTTLRYRWQKGVAMTYLVDSHSQQMMEAMGQSMQTETATRMRVTAVPQEVYPDGSALIDFSVDSLSIRIKSPMGEMTPDVKELLGKHVRMRISATGKRVGAADTTQRIQLSLGRMGSVDLSDNLRSLFVRLSGKPPAFGSTWSETDTSTVNRSGMDVQIISQATHKLVEARPLAGKNCYFGQSEAKFTMEGSGQEPTMGSPLAFEGEGTSSSEWYFDPFAGKLVQLNGTVKMEGTISLSGQAEMTIPIETVSTTSVRLLSAK